MKTDIENITPSIAEFYLLRNHSNRPIRSSVVKFYADIIRRGKWQLTHQGIAFDETGKLLDGQHRLKAICTAGIAVPMMVTHGATSNSFDCLDLGLKRSVSDIMQIKKQYAETLACLTRMLAGQHKTSIDMIEDVASDILPLLEELLDYAPTACSYFSSAPSRSCAILHMTNINHKEYVKELYRNLVLADLNALPPIGTAITRQLLQGKISSKSSYDTFSRMWVVFDRAKMNLTKVVVSDTTLIGGIIRAEYVKNYGEKEWMINEKR